MCSDSSLSVLSPTGLRLFSISSQDKVEEIFAKDNTEQIRIVERLFNSSLVVLVTAQKPNCLKMLHFKKKQDICNCFYPSEILCVRMNRQRLIVCLAESIHIHDIRDMKILHSIENIAPNEQGLCALSLNSHLAFPVCQTSGELRIFNASKLRTGMTIRAHDTSLSALAFSPSGALLATASERGTVIRVFCVKNGQRVQEFRRGVSCVRIASLVFSASGDFLCASSNTETVHVFKIDTRAVETVELKAIGEYVGQALALLTLMYYLEYFLELSERLWVVKQYYLLLLFSYNTMMLFYCSRCSCQVRKFCQGSSGIHSSRGEL